MNTQTDPGSKNETAIQVRVCGNDVERNHFEEVSTVIPTPNGALLETVHELSEGTTLELTRPSTHHKAIAKVKSMGPKLGLSTLVFVEGLGVEDLWNKESNAEREERKTTDAASGAPSAGDVVSAGALVPLSERRGLSPSGLRMPRVDRLMESLTDLVESALEENLRPTVERLTNEIPERVAKARSSMFLNIETQLEAAAASFGERLDNRALVVANQNEQALNQKAGEILEEAGRQLQSKQEEFLRNAERESRSAQERLNNEAETIASQGLAQLQQNMRAETERLEARITERALALAEETMHTLGNRVQQVETDSADRIRQKIDQFLEGFPPEFEKRVDELLALQMAAMDRRLEGTTKALSDHAQQVEKELAERLDKHAQEIASRFHAQLQESFQQELLDQEAQLQEQLTAKASQFHSKFLEQLESELNENKEKMVQEAHFLLKTMRNEDQKRIAGMLREWAQAVENPAEAVS